jgi:hypothetical protein
VGNALMGAAVLVIGDAGRTEALVQTMRLWTLVLVIDGVISLSYTLSPRKPKTEDAADASPRETETAKRG